MLSRIAAINYRIVKRTTDIAFGLAGTAVTLPLRLLLPTIKQTREGKGGKKVTIDKFKSLPGRTQEEEGREKTWAEAQKIREVGNSDASFLGHLLRLSGLDELPQSQNVLKGQMTILGPRILPKSVLDDIELQVGPEWRRKRQEVVPGILPVTFCMTGKAYFSAQEWANHEMKYLSNQSLSLDLRLLLRGLSFILAGKNT